MEVVMNMEDDPVFSGVFWKFPTQLPDMVLVLDSLLRMDSL